MPRAQTSRGHLASALALMVGGLLLPWTPQPAHAQEKAYVNRDALPGLGLLPTALPARTFSTAGQLYYGYRGESLNDGDTHQTLGGTIAAGLSPLRSLMLGLRVGAAIDRHKKGDSLGTGSGAPNGTQLYGQAIVRVRGAVTSNLHLGGELLLDIPPGDSAKLSVKGITPSVAGLLTYQLGGFSVTGRAGLRIDRRGLTFPSGGSALNEYERLALGIDGDTDADLVLLVGAGTAFPVGPAECFAEVTYDYGLDKTVKLSPLTAQVGVRGRPLDFLEIGGLLGVGLTPAADDVAVEQPVPHRVLAQVTLALHWMELLSGSDNETSPEHAESPAEQEAVGEQARPEQPEMVMYAGHVRGPHGAPLTAELTLRGQAGETQGTETDGEGHYAFAAVAPGEWELEVRAEGYQPYTQKLSLPLKPGEDPGQQEIALERQLPPGQIEVRVQDFRGRRVEATVTLKATGEPFHSMDETGTYVLDLQPGEYKVQVSAPGYAPQERTAVVKENGVTIVVIDLRNSQRRKRGR